MPHKHRAFLLDMLAKIGAPMFAATLVSCLIKDEIRLIHIILISIGLAFLYLGHRLEYHDG